jgi:hypothetical protein
VQTSARAVSASCVVSRISAAYLGARDTLADLGGQAEVQVKREFARDHDRAHPQLDDVNQYAADVLDPAVTRVPSNTTVSPAQVATLNSAAQAARAASVTGDPGSQSSRGRPSRSCSTTVASSHASMPWTSSVAVSASASAARAVRRRSVSPGSSAAESLAAARSVAGDGAVALRRPRTVLVTCGIVGWNLGMPN